MTWTVSAMVIMPFATGSMPTPLVRTRQPLVPMQLLPLVHIPLTSAQQLLDTKPMLVDSMRQPWGARPTLVEPNPQLLVMEL